MEEYIYEKTSQINANLTDTDTNISKGCDATTSLNDNNSDQSPTLNSNNETWRNNTNQEKREVITLTTGDNIMSTSNINVPVIGGKKSDDTTQKPFSSTGYVAETNNSKLSFGWTGVMDEEVAISHQNCGEYVVEEDTATAQDAVILDSEYSEEEHQKAILIDDSSKPDAYIRESSLATSSSAFTPMTNACTELTTPYIIDSNISSLGLSLPEDVDVHQSAILFDDLSKPAGYIRESSPTTSSRALAPQTDASVAINTTYVVDPIVSAPALSLPDNIDVNQSTLVMETYPPEQTAINTNLLSEYIPDPITTTLYNQELEAESYNLCDLLQNIQSDSASTAYLQEEQAILNTIHPQQTQLHHKEETSSNNNHNTASQYMFSSESYLSASFNAMTDKSNHPQTLPTPSSSSTNMYTMINVPPHSLTPPKDNSGSCTDSASSYVSDVSALDFASSSSSGYVSSTENTGSSMSTTMCSFPTFETELESILYNPSGFSDTKDSSPEILPAFLSSNELLNTAN